MLARILCNRLQLHLWGTFVLDLSEHMILVNHFEQQISRGIIFSRGFHRFRVCLALNRLCFSLASQRTLVFEINCLPCLCPSIFLYTDRVQLWSFSIVYFFAWNRLVLLHLALSWKYIPLLGQHPLATHVRLRICMK